MCRSFSLTLLILVLLPLGAASAAPLPGDRDLIRERQQHLIEEQRKRLEELQQLPLQPEQLEPGQDEDGHCLNVSRIRLQGAELIDEKRRGELLSPYLGQCLGDAGLNRVLQSITGFYLDRGYVTSRAYLPQQDLSGGELTVVIVEGRLEALEGSGIASARELAMVSPAVEGGLLNLRELEQTVDQLGRLPSRSAELELLPGEAVGGSKVLLTGVRGSPWRAGLNRHNDGQASTGEQQWGGSLEWDSPLGLADQLSLRGGGDAVSDHWRHSANQGLSYSLPYGWWTFAYSYSQSYYRTRNEGLGFAFALDGESKSHQLRAERVLHRDSLSRTGVSFGLGHLRTRNYVEDSLIRESSNRLSDFQFGLSHGRRLGTGFFNLDAGWQRGIGALDAQRAGRPRKDDPVARFNKYSLTASYLQPFTLGEQTLSFDSLAHGQRSEDVLFSSQRLGLGGLSAVRGYKEQSLYADTGAYWRNQLRWRLPARWEPIRPFVQEYGLAIAYDLGVAHGDAHNADQHGRLSSHAFEFSARGPHLAASLTLAHSLERPRAIERRERPAYFRLDLFF
ncbi:hemolysin activation/secretion protein [Pseudomonas alcaligenes]|nr:hemolysin activation/secretion protein [Pseudomonas alcaligenes]